jgi:hypothetical protein
MKVKPLEIKPKGWGRNAIKVTITYLQHREHGRTKMSVSTQRHGNLYISEELLHAHQEVQRGMETISIARGFAWQSTLAQYCQHHEEWDENKYNDEVEQILP